MEHKIVFHEVIDGYMVDVEGIEDKVFTTLREAAAEMLQLLPITHLKDGDEVPTCTLTLRKAVGVTLVGTNVDMYIHKMGKNKIFIDRFGHEDLPNVGMSYYQPLIAGEYIAYHLLSSE